MKRIIALFLAAHFAAISPFCEAATAPQQHASVVQRKKATGAQVFFVKQNYEGPGHDNGEVWDDDGTVVVNPDATDAPAPLKGAQSLSLSNGGGTVYEFITFPAKSECWGHARIHPANGQGNFFPTFYFGNATNSYGIILVNGGPGSIDIKVYNSGVGATSASVPAWQQTLYAWIHFVRNATTTIYVSTTPTRPTTDGVDGAVLTFTPAGDDDVIYLGVGVSIGTYHFDNVLASETEIGDNPLP